MFIEAFVYISAILKNISGFNNCQRLKLHRNTQRSKRSKVSLGTFDSVTDIYMIPIVYYVGFDQWTCTWAGVQKPRCWLTHWYSRQNLAYSHSLNQIHITRLPNWFRKRQYRKCTVWIAQLAAVYLLTTYPTITDVFQGFFFGVHGYDREQ